ncbi:MAG TPA: hypothetical protein VFL85_03030, partial [Candidatus Saccharimonadales bacterium]|nr:hypothetical protein [Candidatus Saccharimonadales bacterium]
QRTDIHDAEIREILERIFVLENDIDYRQFYWALMDYGTYLKQTVGNLSRASRTYAKQPPFHGSQRQLRGRVLKLLAGKPRPEAELSAAIRDERLPAVLADLMAEQMIVLTGNIYELA